MNSDDNNIGVAIVDQPFSVDETEQPFGKRWGGECFTLNAEHLTALQAGKTLALDVQNEYVTFVRLQHANDELQQNVIPAQAGIQSCCEVQPSSTTALDTRIRGYDGVGCGAGSTDTAEAGGLGYEL